jgi:asparagine synthase (glutamine-hydrolysing)
LPVRVSRLGSAFRRRQIADLASARTRQELYRELVSIWRSPGDAVPGAVEPATALAGPLPEGLPSFLSEMTYLDLVSYLPDDILVKVDRASMGVSLEARVPLLDHRLIELAASLPDDLRVRDCKQKWILRQVLHRYVPPALVERPKMGFGVPMAAWLRGPLREWASDLLSTSALKASGHLATGPITALLDGHLSGREDFQAPLWNVLVFEAWWRAQRTGRAET